MTDVTRKDKIRNDDVGIRTRMVRKVKDSGGSGVLRWSVHVSVEIYPFI